MEKKCSLCPEKMKVKKNNNKTLEVLSHWITQSSCHALTAFSMSFYCVSRISSLALHPHRCRTRDGTSTSRRRNRRRLDQMALILRWNWFCCDHCFLFFRFLSFFFNRSVPSFCSRTPLFEFDDFTPKMLRFPPTLPRPLLSMCSLHAWIWILFLPVHSHLPFTSVVEFKK